jgi:hypothetical protein
MFLLIVDIVLILLICDFYSKTIREKDKTIALLKAQLASRIVTSHIPEASSQTTTQDSEPRTA